MATIPLSCPDIIKILNRSAAVGSSVTSNVSTASTSTSSTIVTEAHAVSSVDWPAVNVSTCNVGKKSKSGVAIERV